MNTEVKREETWYDYPQKVKSWGNDIDYVMFVDENNSVDKQQVVYKKILAALFASLQKMPTSLQK